MKASNKVNSSLLMYHCLQYSHNKAIRTKYRINGPQLNILISIYYGTQINPQRWGRSIKHCIRHLNPHLGPHYILRDIVLLDNKDLIKYSEQTPKKYSITITGEGMGIVEGLFNPESLDTFIRGKV